MLQIRLRNKGTSADGGGAAKLSSGETVTVACPDHLVLAELPVAKSLGSAGSVSHVKIVGRRTRRSLGERVHFCVRCDYPIAIYGRLSPCEHAFCLDCARSDSICYLCDERVQKIQTIKMMEGIFICAAPHCLKSFLKKSDFESHIRTIHADLLRPSIHRDGNDSEAASAKRPSASESTVQAPPRPAPSSSSNSQAHNREDRVHRPQVPQELQPPLRPAIQPRPPPLQPPFVGQIPNHPSDQQTESRPPGFDGAEAVNNFPQQVYVVPQQGIQSETPYHDYQAAPNFAVPVNPNFLMVSPSFGYPPGQEQGSLLGFPPGFAETHPQQWTGAPFDSSSVMGNRGTGDNSTMNLSDSQGRTVGVFYQGPMQGDSRDGKGILAPQPPLPPPPPPPPLMAPHMPQMQGGNYFSPGDQGHSGQGFRWQHDKRDNFGSGQD